ncbi:MAG: hypothetical protein EBZ50_16375 [Alphaproteobacteria bacterium]|nr:hypothetical protein [Alphaproteobacteria bacterium]
MQQDTFAAALAAFDAAHAAVRAWPKDDDSPGFAAVSAREGEALEALLRTPAKTLSALRLKLRALRACEGAGDAAPGESRAELAGLSSL